MSDSPTIKTLKTPAFWQHHWPDGKPSCIITDGVKPPTKVTDGWIYVFHPEQEIEHTLLPAKIERKHGFAQSIREIDLSNYVKRGDRLSWRQRLMGVA